MKLAHPLAISGFARTPVGKLGGVLAGVEPYQLLAPCLRHAAGAVVPDEVIVGNVRNSIGNIARVAALEAGLPDTVPAMTLDRQCASGMEALATGAAKILSGMAECVLAGGVESASQAPWLYEKTPRAFAYGEPRPFRIRMATEEAGDPPMGETAEILADKFSISREAMDAFAAASHQKAAAAREALHAEFAITLDAIAQAVGPKTPRESLVDECVRADSTAAQLAKLRPVFRPKDGRVTAGNSSPLNDGAAACLLARPEFLDSRKLPIDALLVGVSTVALDPKVMGLGPALAIPKLLKSCGLGMKDIDLFEINEAFAAQVLACLRQLEQDVTPLPADRLNVFGGALALGHPLGASGLRIVRTLISALRARGLRRGVASLCVGGGQGMAVLIEIPA